MQRWPLHILRMTVCGPFAAAFAATITLWLAQPRLDRSIPAYSPPATIPAEFQTTITLCRKGGEPYWTGDGRELYRRCHRDGWDDCRLTFGFDHEWRYNPDYGMWVIGAPGYVIDAREIGWKDCSNALTALLLTQNESALRAKVLNRHHWEAPWVGGVSLAAALLVMGGAAWVRRLSVAIGAIYLAWVGVMIAFRQTWDGGLFNDPPIGVVPFLVILVCGLAVAIATIATDRWLSAPQQLRDTPTGRHAAPERP